MLSRTLVPSSDSLLLIITLSFLSLEVSGETGVLVRLDNLSRILIRDIIPAENRGSVCDVPISYSIWFCSLVIKFL